jgi:hypothetical protein
VGDGVGVAVEPARVAADRSGGEADGGESVSRPTMAGLRNLVPVDTEMVTVDGGVHDGRRRGGTGGSVPYEGGVAA